MYHSKETYTKSIGYYLYAPSYKVSLPLEQRIIKMEPNESGVALYHTLDKSKVWTHWTQVTRKVKTEVEYLQNNFRRLTELEIILYVPSR